MTEQQPVPELKPCPFDGGTEVVIGWGSCDGPYVRCFFCDTYIFGDSEAEVVEKWNTRQHPPTARSKRLAEIYSRLSKISPPPYTLDVSAPVLPPEIVQDREVPYAIICQMGMRETWDTISDRTRQQVADDADFFVHAPDDIRYLLSRFAPPAASERCGECGHYGFVDSSGTCRAFVKRRDEANIQIVDTCRCKCVVPATSPTTEHEEGKFEQRDVWAQRVDNLVHGGGGAIAPTAAEGELCGAVVSVAVPGSYCTRLKDHKGGHSEGAYEVIPAPAPIAATVEAAGGEHDDE